MYNILISGYYGFHNIGDEAVLRTVVDSIQSSIEDADITILSHDPADTREKYGVHAVPRMSLPGIIHAIRHCDMLVSGGGSLLQDVTSKRSILYYLFIIGLALLFHKKVFIYSQGIGPIVSPFSRRLTAKYLRRVDGIAVRDQRSAQFLQEIGVPPDKLHVTADPVLRLAPADLEKGREILDAIGCKQDQGRLLVGWAIRTPDSSSDPAVTARFIQEVKRSVRWLRDTCHADSVLIPFHYEQDAKIIHQLSQELGQEVYCITDKHLSDEMLSIIGNLDLLVGVRLHSLIYAAVMGIPFLGVSYDPKIDAFLDSISMKPISTVEDFTLEKFQPEFESTLQHQQELTASTAKQVEALIKKLDKNDQMVREIAAQPPKKEKKRSGGIASAIGGVMLITIIAKVFGILRESVQASVFGTADAFYDSYNKTIYLFTTAAYAMCIAAVPIITKDMALDRKRGQKTANNLITFSLLLSLLGLGVWELLTLSPVSQFVYGAIGGELISYIRIMALSLPVIVVAYIMVAVFQSLDHFALQGSMGLPYSVFLIVYLALFGKTTSLHTYVILVCAAWLLQFAMCLPYCVKERYRYRPVLDLRQGYLKTFLKTSVVTIITSSMYLFCYLLDASRCSGMGQGMTSAFYYADKIFTPLTTTFIYSISAVMFPKFNKQYTRSGETEYKKYVWSITSSTLVIVFPVCALLMVFGGPMIKVLFESGNFTADSTATTTSVFVMYALGMAGFSVIDLLNKAFYTMNRSFAPLAISLGVIALNYVLNLVFGVTGPILALTTAAAMTIGAVITIVVMFRGSGIVKLGSSVKALIASGVVGAAVYGMKYLLVSATDGKLLLIVKCGGIGIVSLVLFLGLCFVLRIPEVTEVMRGKLKKA